MPALRSAEQRAAPVLAVLIVFVAAGAGGFHDEETPGFDLPAFPVSWSAEQIERLRILGADGAAGHHAFVGTGNPINENKLASLIGVYGALRDGWFAAPERSDVDAWIRAIGHAAYRSGRDAGEMNNAERVPAACPPYRGTPHSGDPSPRYRS